MMDHLLILFVPAFIITVQMIALRITPGRLYRFVKEF
jgi:hypothetical protein